MRSRRSLWIQTLLLTSFPIWGTIWASTSHNTLPAPKVLIRSRSGNSLVLLCQTSEGHLGVLFRLFRLQQEVDSLERSPTEDVLFTVQLNATEHFCCSYKNQQGFYSAVSPYLTIQHHANFVPTQGVPTLPSPVLSVEPRSGIVELDEVLYFRCSVPALQSSSKATSFTLLKDSMTSQQHDARVSNLESQLGLFSVGPVTKEERGEYACLYQTTTGENVVHSTISNKIQIYVKDVLPVPTLVLEQSTQVWHMLCKGSPAYPGAVFTLYLLDSQLPVASHHIQVTSHETTFPMPVQDTLVALYQCQYSIFLGGQWTYSERSRPLTVSKVLPPPTNTEISNVDWPLMLGSLSAVVLFLCSLALLAVVIHKRVKATADEKKTRLEAKFWTQVHAKDHVVDLTLSRTNVTSQGWISGEMCTETSCRSPSWNSHSTFTNPVP
ncbi:uncharacterized protein LOC144198365 [Stigmatopora nigra]